MDETSIVRYRRIADDLATSGQPDEDELELIVNAGYQVVINLGLNDVEYAVENEAAFFEARNITYIHIPVSFEHPETSELEQFIRAMQQHAGRRLFIHCAANKRVSVFLALYRILVLNWSVDSALHEIHATWQPDEVWQTFIDQQLQIRGF